jgi:hypothetical protein
VVEVRGTTQAVDEGRSDEAIPKYECSEVLWLDKPTTNGIVSLGVNDAQENSLARFSDF